MVGLALSGKPSAPPAPPTPAPVEAPPPEASVDVDMAGLRLVAPHAGKPTRAAAKPAVGKGGAQAAAPADKVEGLVRVTVESDPPGAQVWDGPVVRGTTPATVLLPKSTTPRVLTLKLEGYEDKTTKVVPDKDASVVQKLVAAPATKEPAPVEAKTTEAPPAQADPPTAQPPTVADPAPPPEVKPAPVPAAEPPPPEKPAPKEPAPAPAEPVPEAAPATGE